MLDSEGPNPSRPLHCPRTDGTQRIMSSRRALPGMGGRRTASRLGRVALVGLVTVLTLAPGYLASASGTPGARGPAGILPAAVYPSTCATKPQLSIAATPTAGTVPLRVQFTSNITGGCAPYVMEWEFGDASEKTGLNVNHTFRSAGNFTVFAEVTDSSAASAEDRTTIHVSGGAGSLAVNVSVTPDNGTAPLQVTAWANVTGGNTSQTGTIQWTFGDGGSGTGSPIYHTFGAPGTYTLLATTTINSVMVNGSATVVVAAGGGTGSATNLSLLALPPSAHPPANISIYAFTNGANPPFNLTVCFGDGSDCAMGPSEWNGSSPALLVHQYLSPGNYSVQGTLTTPGGSIVAGASVLVQVTPGPTLEVEANASVIARSSPVQVTFLSTVTGGTPPYSIQWWFGDGTVGASASGVPVNHTYASAGSFHPFLLVGDAAGNLRNITFAAIEVASTPSGSVIPSSFAGLPTTDSLLILAVASIIGGLAIGLRWGRRARAQERAKEGEELVRELEEHR